MKYLFLISFIIVIIPIVISLYSYFIFLPLYMTKEKSLDYAYLHYVGYVHGQNGSYLMHIYYSQSRLWIVVYEFEGWISGEVGAVRLSGVVGNAVCNTSSSALGRLLFPENGTAVGSWRLFLRPGGYIRVPNIRLAEPHPLLGFGPYYIGALYDENGTLIAGIDSTPIQALLYTKIANRYVAYTIKLGGRGFEALASGTLNLTGCGLGRIDSLVLLLNDTNAIPGDQPWGMLFVSNFNALFPMSYGMIFAGILLLLYGWRRWK